MREKLKRALSATRSLFSELSACKCTTLAGTLAYFLFASVMPFLFWLSILFGRLAAREELFGLELFGWAREILIALQRSAAEASAGADVLFLAATLWSSSAFFYHLRRSGELVYGAPHGHGFKVRFVAIAMTLAVLFYVAAACALLVGTVLLIRNLPALLRDCILYSVLFVLAFFGAWLIGIYACPSRPDIRASAKGSLLTAALWLAAAAAFSLFLRISDRGRLYGALTLAVAVLLFFYWMMVCTVAGMVCARRISRLGALKEERKTGMPPPEKGAP